MSTVSPDRAPPSKGSRVAFWIGILLLLGAAAVAAYGWWLRQQADAAQAEQHKQLQVALERSRKLSEDLDAIKPPDAPICPAGQSLKTLAPDATVPLSPAKPAAPDAKAGQAAVLPDVALAQRLEQTTAMVLVTDGKQLGAGTGFFIAPNLLVTNRHVVEMPNARLLLASRSLGSVRRATLLKTSPPGDFGAPDFALLRLEDGSAPATLDLAQELGKLAPVVAAGYPAVVVKSDPNFRRLMEGDATAAPDLNLTQGAVQSLQPGASGTPMVVHTASIAKGNSGGPLVDACGRLVAVNTYISVDKEQSSKINYAIQAASMVTFLGTAGVTPTVDRRSCGQRP